MDTDCPLFESLEKEITTKKSEVCIHKLNTNKSAGNDQLINEYFSEYCHLILPILVRLFNKILNSGVFPSSWSKAIIIPIHEKWNIIDPNNYRGISITSSLGKLFTSILNERVMQLDRFEDIITVAQFGFQAGRSTTDTIFALHSLITEKLDDIRKVYLNFNW